MRAECSIYKIKLDKNRSYEVKGLSKGTYSVTVAVSLNSGDYLSSSKEIKIKGYKDKTKENKKYDFSKVKVGDIIKFGVYEQDGLITNGKEDIEWIVLSKSKSELFVVSRYILDSISYDNDWKENPITWEKCSLRKWLNKVFYKLAFSKQERKMIKEVTLKNPDSIDVTKVISGGLNTKDKVFLLSNEDIQNSDYGFSKDNNETRICTPTTYAISHGAYSPWRYSGLGEGGMWWIRAPFFEGFEGKIGELVVEKGAIGFNYGEYDNEAGVRPAMYISLK